MLAALLLMLAGLTDILDGLFARYYKVANSNGALLDSLADYAYYTSFAIWMVLFYPQIITSNIPLIVTGFVLTVITFFLLFRTTTPPPHLDSSRVAGFGFFVLMTTLILNKTHPFLPRVAFALWNLALLHILSYIYIQNKLDNIITKVTK